VLVVVADVVDDELLYRVLVPGDGAVSIGGVCPGQRARPNIRGPQA
jgi:hypothetical protein